MAIQEAQFYSDNVCFGGGGGSGSGSGDNGGLGSGAFNQFRFDHQQQQLQQRHEIDQFIISQNERLRLLLEQQRNQQITMFLNKIESRALILLNQKDEEIQKAKNKLIELQNLLKKLEMDNQGWKKVAYEKEAMAMCLNNKLQVLKERASCCFINGVDDAESCCEDEDTRMVCKCCNSRSSCVLFLPCRHLCSCKNCEALLESCPVCKTAKKASIEALVS
ncbi:E3 ubiquitin-protein ligase BOI-like [Gossypium australe]|uniref:E3 ubiquitin-protein ligase BOI-like n=1 Tax=Gossypium australe TaxID=47621 RepID=A0A5B6VG15_9ROSI|nr:E3 ubiquitin-protein ligase BOI-like [Gossypium australe]